MNNNSPIIRNLRIIYYKTTSTLKGLKEIMTRVANTSLELPIDIRYTNWEMVQGLIYLKCIKNFPYVFDTSDPRIENCLDWYDFKKMTEFNSHDEFHKLMNEGDTKALKDFRILNNKEDLPEVLKADIAKCVQILSHTEKFTLSKEVH